MYFDPECSAILLLEDGYYFEGLVLQQERLTGTMASSSCNNNNTNVAEYVVSSFEAIVEHFEMQIIDGDLEGKENNDTSVKKKKKKKTETLEMVRYI